MSIFQRDTCGAPGGCGKRIRFDQENHAWQTGQSALSKWCPGPDGTRVICEQEHAPAWWGPSMAARSRDGEACRCCLMDGYHVHPPARPATPEEVAVTRAKASRPEDWPDP